MIIGHYVSHVAVKRGYERNVSGHVQTPLQSMRLLLEAGHEVHLITTEYGDDRALPDFMPAGARVHQVLDSRTRGEQFLKGPGHRPGVRPLDAVRQARQIIRIARERRFDVLHMFGHNRTAHLGGALRMMGLRTPVVMTVITARFPERLPGPVSRLLWGRLDAVVSSTEFVKGMLAAEGIEARVVRQGVIRRLSEELGGRTPGPRARVLFWRDPSFWNGADVALDVFDRLAPRHPDVSFDLAVRPHPNEVELLEEIPARHPNVHLHRFPYPEGVTLAGLVHESLCVLMPMRRHTIDPQLSIAESMDSGVAVIASDLNSTPEMISHGENGMLIPVGDVDAAERAVEEMLSDRERAIEMGRRAAEVIRTGWNWDRYLEEILSVYGVALRR